MIYFNKMTLIDRKPVIYNFSHIYVIDPQQKIQIVVFKYVFIHLQRLAVMCAVKYFDFLNETKIKNKIATLWLMV